MSMQTNNLEHLLATLGEARQNGAFDGGAAGFPWQAATVSTQSSKQSWQARFWKVIPLAAAAAVAVLFVGPSWAPDQGGSPIVSNVPASTGPETCVSIEGDFNGDGVRNGEDISAGIKLIESGEINLTPDEVARKVLRG